MNRFVIVDDDISIRRIIQNIIEKHQLGIVVAECEDGAQAENAIRECQPDIALVDLLLPVQDGVQLIKRTRTSCSDTAYVMISQASSEPLITQAYVSGIEFFIHKPINVLELVSIINKVNDNRNLRKAMSIISKTTAQYTTPVPLISNDPVQNTGKTRIYKVFSDLGIIGEVGAKEIYKITQLIESHIQNEEKSKYQLCEQYQQLASQINEDAKTIEQRVRRTIVKALQGLALIGLDDYYNDIFQTYSTALFDFKEVRAEMDFIKGKSQYRGRINVKKFIEGLLFIAERNV